MSACAALRAGITRPAPLDFQVASRDDLAVEAVMGHPLTGVSDGFSGLGLHVHLASLALRDLLHYGKLDATDTGFWRDTALWVCTSLPRIEEEADGEALQRLLESRLCSALVHRVGLAIPPDQQRFMPRGHTSVLGGVAEAFEALSHGRVRRALVVGVDSLVGEEELQWFAFHRRLKTPEQAVGLMPGEASAALLLESEGEARRRQAVSSGLVSAVEVLEPSLDSQDVPPGLSLARVIEATMAQASRIHTVYGDLNGEEWKARQWGSALVRLSSRPPFQAMRQSWPAISLGDTGAASGAIQLALACRTFLRNPSSGDTALVWSQSDSGAVASALVHRAQANTPV
ncbi:hypothetical protein OV208_32935 [Corallococcus sp. bb12-1]|uniref:hypothetical protein n=1 Tax=Corallococcus sp. bb12-1 TaxID=2996784 RepID=UPI00226D7D72|nr:hypothetical protein [Corallococcus sp. bb12-1]MCY1046163.1 hypothetical protein [Corallococcus sp. bb12-1]